MHAMACLTADALALPSAISLFLSLGETARDTGLTAGERLLRAAGVYHATQPTLQCSRKACSRRPWHPGAVPAVSHPDTPD